MSIDFIVTSWKAWRLRRYWTLERQVEHLRNLINSDWQWLAGDPVADALTTRYRRALSWQWYRLEHEYSAALRRRLALEPREWRAMVYAPLDGTKVQLLIRHQTWWSARKKSAAAAEAWQATAVGQWVDHNGGGWSWNGMAGEPVGWRPTK